MNHFRANNHYVPKLYLKGWIRDDRIATYRLLVPSESYPVWKMQSLKGIAVHRHLYTSIVAGQETDRLERWLESEFERPATDVIDRVHRELPLTPNQWHILIKFLAAQDVRTPARLRDFLKRHNEILPSLIDQSVASSVKKLEHAAISGEVLATADTGSLPDFPIRIFVNRNEDGSGRVRAETLVGRQLWISAFEHLLTKTATHLLNHRWTILNAPNGMTWPTSDNPVMKLNFVGLNDYDFKGGWGREGGEIFMPLGPKHLLYTHIGCPVPRRGTVPARWMADKVRRMLIEHADRFVFADQEQDCATIRPRRVSQEAFRAEQEAWNNWAISQSRAEAEFFAPDRS